MSDHVDGPRSIGDPSIDLTDLFAFNSPENSARTGWSRMFSPRRAQVQFSPMW
jgi:hypothetical protein